MKEFDLRVYLAERGMQAKNIDSVCKFPYLDQYENADDFAKSFAGVFLLKHPKNKRVIIYVHEALKTKRVQWSDFTSVNLTDVYQYMTGKVASNSLRTYFAQLKRIIKPYVDDRIVPCSQPNEILTSRKEPSDKISLSAVEVDKFWKFQDKLGRYSQKYTDIWHDFMLCTYLGCRVSDLDVIGEHSIIPSKGMVEYTSVKTKIKAYPPLHPNVLTLLRMPRSNEKYDYCAMGRVVKRIAKDIGIDEQMTLFNGGRYKTGAKWEFVSMHTSRHTFATLMECGAHPVPITELSKYMGHTNPAITWSYVDKRMLPMTSNIVETFSI